LLTDCLNGGAKGLKNHVLAIESDSGEGMKVIQQTGGLRDAPATGILAEFRSACLL
jgi:hypothetical protein